MPEINPSIIVIIIIAIVSSLVRKGSAKMRGKMAEQEQRMRKQLGQQARIQEAPPSAAQTGFQTIGATAYPNSPVASHNNRESVSYEGTAHPDYAHEGNGPISDTFWDDYADEGDTLEGAPRQYIPENRITPHDTHEGEAFDDTGHFVHKPSAISDVMNVTKDEGSSAYGHAHITIDQLRQGIVMKEILTRRVWTPGR